MSCGLLLGFLLVAIGGFREVQGHAVVEIHFLEYSADCHEHVIPLIYTDVCDPYFSFCLDRPRDSTSISPCYYGSTGESGYFKDTNRIDFSTMGSIKGISNPWIFKIPAIKDRTMTLVSLVRDHDSLNDDGLVSWNTELEVKAYPSRRDAEWTKIELNEGSYTLILKYRIYCQASYYGRKCENSGNPCERKPCKNGMKCKELSDDNSYTCICKPPTSGRHCEIITPDKN